MHKFINLKGALSYSVIVFFRGKDDIDTALCTKCILLCEQEVIAQLFAKLVSNVLFLSGRQFQDGYR
ncbi:hypothetical protein AB685_04375 [Bacillus sp. LL01]|nr:hypothetical protein AB685_04375 [Bacillus sp. LL01]